MSPQYLKSRIAQASPLVSPYWIPIVTERRNEHGKKARQQRRHRIQAEGLTLVRTGQSERQTHYQVCQDAERVSRLGQADLE